MARRPLSILDFYSAEQPFATEFRRLLHRIKKNENEAELKSLLITSAMLSEGKSTISSFLAVTAARQKGMKTLLIDADLRRPTVHKFFAMERDNGLAEILADNYNPVDMIKHTEMENLHIMTAGKRVPSPTDIFDAQSIGRIVDEMKFYYDIILVDCAPVLPVSDPMLLASKLDGIVLVVKAGATQKEVVERAVEILSTNNHRVLGIVLNNMNNSLPYYYDYNYYYYEDSDKKTKTKRNSISHGSAGNAHSRGRRNLNNDNTDQTSTLEKK
ncbi:MAG: CpsD/CapB family tyrosine-protein kinase [bacterium]